LSTEICSKCVAGQVAEASSLIYPKRDAGATCTRPRIAGTEWRQPELKCSVVRRRCALINIDGKTHGSVLPFLGKITKVKADLFFFKKIQIFVKYGYLISYRLPQTL